jgi:GNAT superfamily N-acetyltransferase
MSDVPGVEIVERSAAADAAAPWRRLVELPLGPARTFWLALRGDEVVGRIGAGLSGTYPGVGYVGFFELDPGAAQAEAVAGRLIDEACAWLRARGATRAYGPLDLTTWFSYRFRVPASDADANEHEEAPFWWEPQNPPEHTRWFERRGFSEAQRYHSHGFDGDPPGVAEMIVAFTGMAREAAEEAGFSFRPIDEARLDAELPILHRLSMESFADAFLFEPLPFPIFEAMYRSTANRVDYALSRFVVDPEGREVGFAFGFIDRGYAVVKTIAVLPAFRGHRLSTALLHLVLAGGLARGVRRGLSALVRAGSKSQFLEGKHAMLRGWRHEYALFEKRLV